MKAYTDIEQSKKLAEILPIESADAWWAERYEGKVTYDGQYIVNEEPYYYISFIKPSETNYSQDTIKDIPCWSLASLLNLMQIDYRVEKTIFDQTNQFTYSIWADDFNINTAEYDELVDACVEMISKLNEQKLL